MFPHFLEIMVSFPQAHFPQIADFTYLGPRLGRGAAERRAGEPVGSEEARFRMRWFTRYELEHLLARAGFGEVSIYGDFDRTPVGRGRPSRVVVAS